MSPRAFVTLGMFIIDQFSFQDEHGQPTGRTLAPQAECLPYSGGGTYATIGARLWLPAQEIGMVVDKGSDFPEDMENTLIAYGEDMWLFRNQPGLGTTQALNSYKGDHRGFQYLTPRIRITPCDLKGTLLERPKTLHFICSPSRAAVIMSEVQEFGNWSPVAIYEPIPDRCIPAELPALLEVLPFINILSPNAEEALSLLSLSVPVSRRSVENACSRFLDLGVGPEGSGWVIIRSGALGAFVASRKRPGEWIDAFWVDGTHVVDVTGAGNGFLGGLAAGMVLTDGDVFKAAFYATVSASYIIEQQGLPELSRTATEELWNGDSPGQRLAKLTEMHVRKEETRGIRG
ncbi:Ribokinase-like protein [Auriscalpium vulgare]|uniref:Ribokinase-like protein n=1 Tax=Auriscalpium vulgare TaxID=40419 RepID=A0ACB8RZN0_9AGAM|nr:Ribokinase-like protein [Auriscalpium vulgare]